MVLRYRKVGPISTATWVPDQPAVKPLGPRRNGDPLALRRLILGALLAGDEGDDDAR